VQHDEGKRERNNKKNRHPEDVMLSLSKYDSESHDLKTTMDRCCIKCSMTKIIEGNKKRTVIPDLIRDLMNKN